nr:MAG TPA: hypothetical protein [Caudoviricetes sp.]
MLTNANVRTERVSISSLVMTPSRMLINVNLMMANDGMRS